VVYGAPSAKRPFYRCEPVQIKILPPVTPPGCS